MFPTMAIRSEIFRYAKNNTKEEMESEDNINNDDRDMSFNILAKCSNTAIKAFKRKQ